jgi:hypothetical protein
MKNKLPETMGELLEFKESAQRTERDRIAKVIANLPFRWDGSTQTITLDKRDVQALVNGETDE